MKRFQKQDDSQRLRSRTIKTQGHKEASAFNKDHEFDVPDKKNKKSYAFPDDFQHPSIEEQIDEEENTESNHRHNSHLKRVKTIEEE
jgi:hypothetical protein